METEVDNNVENNNGCGCLGDMVGFILKGIGVIIFIFAMFYVKACSKSMMRQKLRHHSQTEVVTGNCDAGVDFCNKIA